MLGGSGVKEAKREPQGCNPLPHQTIADKLETKFDPRIQKDGSEVTVFLILHFSPAARRWQSATFWNGALCQEFHVDDEGPVRHWHQGLGWYRVSQVGHVGVIGLGNVEAQWWKKAD